MNKKKIARIIVSPIIFIFMIFAMIIFPLTFIAFIMALLQLIKYPFTDYHEESVSDLLGFLFIFILLPYEETKNWITQNKNYD